MTFIDDYFRCCAVYFLKQKSEVLDKFREFEAIVTNECGQSIGTLRTDNGGEYLSRRYICNSLMVLPYLEKSTLYAS